MEYKTDLSKLKGKNIIVTAGGTGGHIFPALAIAHALKENGANITWVGTRNSMEEKIVSGKFNIQYIKSSGIRGKGLSKKAALPFTLTASVLAATIILKKTKANLVIGFGGYVSGPTCIAAKLIGIPVIIHEQNAKIGLTNRVLAKFAKQVCLAFPIDNLNNYFKEKQLKKFSIVGNPVRSEIVKLNGINRDFSNEKSLNLLVLGGSQGAKAINEKIPSLIETLKDKGINITVWHQTGKLLFDDTKQHYSSISNQNIKEIAPFIENMAEAYEWANVIICRAGALTVSEVAISGLPAIFIPFPAAVDDHQYFNAHTMVENNAGFCLRQEEASVGELSNILLELASDKEKLLNMSENARKTLIKDSTAQILNIIAQTLK